MSARIDHGPGTTVVIGCDSMLELDGMGYGKPGTPAEAARRWQGCVGVLGCCTGHHVMLHQGGAIITRTAVASTLVHFAELTDEEIEAYVASAEPLQVAGGFTVDGLGGPFITGIEGDHHNVVGLSLPLLRTILTELGISWPSLCESLTTAEGLLKDGCRQPGVGASHADWDHEGANEDHRRRSQHRCPGRRHWRGARVRGHANGRADIRLRPRQRRPAQRRNHPRPSQWQA